MRPLSHTRADSVVALGLASAILLGPASVACTPEAVLVPAGNTAETDSSATDTTGTDTTIVRRGTLTIISRTALEDSAIARQLGWTGTVPGASVHAQLGGTVLTATTDTAGLVSFVDILPGDYQVSVLRTLSDAERALLGSAAANVSAFGGGGTITLRSPATDGTLTARATSRGSVVISEYFMSTWTGEQHYYLGTFVELYNNADTTIYLDGKLWGSTPVFHTDRPELGLPCPVGQQWVADPDGLWATRLWRFPGAGTQYALAPGEAAVLAMDAVDHSVVDPRWPDLARVRFEFVEVGDVDNPAAANVTLAFGPATPLNHGALMGTATSFLADATDITTLPTSQPPNFTRALPRVPRAKILDVITVLPLRSYYESWGYTVCPVLINEVFDAAPAFWQDPARFQSVRRKALGGRLLLRSRSTVNDFEIIDAPTPGRVP